MSSWVPALEGVKEKLDAGARVADVGCGKGASTLLLAKAFPRSRFFGFDYHDKSIEGARDPPIVRASPTASHSMWRRRRNTLEKITTS